MALPVYLIHYRAPGWLTTSIASIRASTVPVDVTVIDNGGAPDDLGVRILRMPENVGYTGAANAALSDWPAGEAWVVVASHDLHVEPDTFARMLAAAPDRAGVVGPEFDGGAALAEPAVPVGGVQSRPWVSGTCLLLRRECVDAVGEFDERFGSYVEDIDYCLRARDAGWDVVTVPDARARGVGSVSARALRAIHRNRVLLAVKRSGARGGVHQVGVALKQTMAAVAQRRFGDAWQTVVGLADGVWAMWRMRSSRVAERRA